MKSSTLDALLTDRALGELSPEATELLDAYLAKHPELQQSTRELDTCLGLARSAFPPTSELALGESTTSWQQLVWRERLRVAWPAVLGSAACLCIGLLAGTQLRRASEPYPVEQEPSMTATVSAESSAKSPLLWSREHLLPASRQTVRNSLPERRLTWEPRSLKPRLNTLP